MMSKLGFRIDGRSFQAGEIVFHTGKRAFGAVAGISCGGRYLALDLEGGSYAAEPALVLRIPGAKEFADELGSVDPNLRRWALDSFADGASVDTCRARLRSAMALRG